jgi:hypothetical protein
MFINVKIRVFFEVTENIEIMPNDYIEISIDCYECKALRKSIVIGKNFNEIACEFFGYIPKKNFNDLEVLINDKEKEIAFCTPSCHLFPAYLKNITLTKSNKIIELEYLIEYSYTEFFDIKNKKQSNKLVSWARVGFELICPRCNAVNRQSTQNNIVRPFTVTCACSFVFYTEKTGLPIIEIF